ncbi:DUF1376 domain-containing protein [Methylocystis sp. JR02]|uniref:DUF1376 domain-containing protein n=1 Tax=Methylocystis sp. JR02 TaxID=3046284 RepID=UPI0024BA7A2E|nr:DUF1376 domain-containing protein [Methylocystis sp. JR02]MDJ0449226.1 DUF1376 domain-containing protein [Methylocystis sp. JR02]
MVNAAPAPLVPPDVDLRDFAFMPLDVVRLRDSDLSASANGEEFRAAVLLWCASWHQIPAASLPNDDAILSALAGFGRVVKEWLKVKKGALRGWVLCADGRLYHPVVAEKARDAWESKKKQRDRTAAARAARLSQSAKPTTTEDATTTVTGSVTETVTSSKGQGQYKGQGDIDHLPAQLPTAARGAPPEPPPNDLDRVQAACSAALGESAPADLVIGPMAEMFRKFGEQRVIETLGSEARRTRKKPVKSWRLWAMIVDEALASAEQRPPVPHNGEPPERKIELGYAGVAMPEENLLAAIARWRNNPASWMRNVWGPPPDESPAIRKFAAEQGINFDSAEAAA